MIKIFDFYDYFLWGHEREWNTNEFSFGIPIELFEGMIIMQVSSLSGSFSFDPDIVPNDGMAELTLSPPWLSLDQESGIVPAGGSVDLGATF